MELTSPDGALRADLPESVAALLRRVRGWEPGADRDEVAIPVTRIPGVVDISMARVRKLVADGTIPHTIDGRTKLVKPSDVRAVIAKESK